MRDPRCARHSGASIPYAAGWLATPSASSNATSCAGADAVSPKISRSAASHAASTPSAACITAGRQNEHAMPCATPRVSVIA
ncbi:hypothetical protein TQ36_22010 [Burkholderia cenocepacia]|nr:hypothetical protein TQ36_22010 [Burkholderia cenocepacia]